MAGHWGATLEVYFPKAPIQGQGHFNLQTIVTADGYSFTYVRGVATITADLTLLANAIVAWAGSATFSGGASLGAAGAVILPSIFHLIVIGQSNAAGGGGNFHVSQGLVPRGRKFTGGERPGASGLTTLTTFSGGDGTLDGGCSQGETCVEWLANKLGGNGLFLVSNVAVSGTGYSGLKRGTTPYNNSILQVTRAKAIADALGVSYEPLGFVCVHGEYDTQIHTGNYTTFLTEWQSDYSADVGSVLGESIDLPFYIVQNGSYMTNPPEIWDATQAALDLSMAHPTRFIIASSQYAMSKQTLSGLHMDPVGVLKSGELVGRTIWRNRFEESWSGFYPTTAVRAGTSIVITFNVPVPPLTWDFKEVLQGIAANFVRGFEFHDSTNSANVIDAQITAANQVTLFLNVVPTGGMPYVSYARSGGSHPTGGARGNLADSDGSAGLGSNRGYLLPNYCPMFYLPVT
jgi:hypothetical protein